MISQEIPIQIKLPTPVIPRGKGVHASGIIRAIATETGILDPKWAEEISLVDVREITDPDAVLRISIGLAWEEWYIPNVLSELGVSDHPGEMCIDGIYANPDGESVDVIITSGKRQHVTVVHEVKATYKSINTVGDMRDQWMWLAQDKTYCHYKKTRFVKQHVLFLAGDYKMPIRPQIRCWALEFTQAEVDDNWKLLCQYRDERMKIERKRAHR